MVNVARVLLPMKNVNVALHWPTPLAVQSCSPLAFSLLRCRTSSTSLKNVPLASMRSTILLITVFSLNQCGAFLGKE
jgi:hypothetical protein